MRPPDRPEPVRRVIRKHHALVRLSHWINVPLLLGLIASGLSIYWAAPVFVHPRDPVTMSRDYLMDAGAWIAGALHDRGGDPRNWIYDHFGLGARQLAASLRLHWVLAYLFMLNGLLYVIGLGAGGGWRALLLRLSDAREALAMIRWYLGLVPMAILKRPWPHPPVWSKYNALQRAAYFTIPLLGALAVLSGWAMHKPVQLGWLERMFIDYEGARVVHFVCMLGLAAFIVPHVILAVSDGWDTLRSMVVGWSARIRKGEAEGGAMMIDPRDEGRGREQPREPAAHVPPPPGSPVPPAPVEPPERPEPVTPVSPEPHLPEPGEPPTTPPDPGPPTPQEPPAPGPGPQRPRARSVFAERPEETVEVPARRLSSQTRRDFLLFTAGVAATAAGAWWLLPDRTKARLLPGEANHRLDTILARVGFTRERREAALNRGLTFDDDVAEALYSRNRMVRTYDRSQITPLPNNYDGRTPGPEYLPGWKLHVSGLASGRPERLGTHDLLGRLALREQVTRLVCVEGWSAIAWWGGLRFADFLAAFPPAPSARWAAMRSAVNLDAYGGPRPYYVSIDLETARHSQTLLATHRSGRPLDLAHGAPLRLLAPMKLGLKNIKAITEIAYTAEEPADYWSERGYSKYDGL